MTRFSSRYSATIDDKGRVVLPAPFKKMMGDQADKPVTIEKDVYSNCLNIYPESNWDEKVNLIESKLNPFDEKDLRLMEQFYENFTTVKMADNGRINLPEDYIKHASIKKEVTLIGLGKMIRLWDTDEYEKAKASRPPLREGIQNTLGNKPENG